MFFRVFGAPCQWKPLESPKHVNDPRTVDGYYLGKEGHFSSAVLIYCLERKKIFRVSPGKVRVHELAYTKQIVSKASYGKEITAIIGDGDAVDSEDQPLPTSVPSAKGLHEAEPRVVKEPDVTQFLDYLEDNQEDGTRADLKEMVKELKQSSASQVLDLFRQMLRQKKLQHGVDTKNVVDEKRKRKQSEPVNVQPENKRARVAGEKATEFIWKHSWFALDVSMKAVHDRY
jgi:hypothetical protein